VIDKKYLHKIWWKNQKSVT